MPAADEEADARAYVGMGSNLGDRAGNLLLALRGMTRAGLSVARLSSVYETEPVGEVLDQREFLNAVLRVETALDPEGLLDACKAVEGALGRELSGPGYVRHGPRPIDVDLLLLGDLTYESDRLRLPHREVTSRRFVLVPLLELDPGLEVPGAGPARPFLDAIEGQDVRLVGPPLAH